MTNWLKNWVHLSDLRFLVLNKVKCLALRFLGLLKGLSIVTNLREKCSPFVVMVSLLIIFDNHVNPLHVLVDEIAIKAKLLFANIVSTGPKRFSALNLFLSRRYFRLLFFTLGTIHGITTSFNCPIYEPDELLNLIWCIVARHLLCFLASCNFFPVSFCLVN